MIKKYSVSLRCFVKGNCIFGVKIKFNLNDKKSTHIRPIWMYMYTFRGLEVML